MQQCDVKETGKERNGSKRDEVKVQTKTLFISPFLGLTPKKMMAMALRVPFVMSRGRKVASIDLSPSNVVTCSVNLV